ncbi:unnamed protein product, partial [Ectocarpus fasciculatus]
FPLLRSLFPPSEKNAPRTGIISDTVDGRCTCHTEQLFSALRVESTSGGRARTYWLIAHGFPYVRSVSCCKVDPCPRPTCLETVSASCKVSAPGFPQAKL